MSINKYDSTSGTLTNLASGSRIWTGSEAAYKAERSAGTLPTNALIMITDDEVDTSHYSTDETFTGMYWIDGKKIYRKVFTGVHFGRRVTTWTDSGIQLSNVSTLVNCKPMRQRTRAIISSFDFQLGTSGDTLYYWGDLADYGDLDTLIVEYTKTTDD